MAKFTLTLWAIGDRVVVPEFKIGARIDRVTLSIIPEKVFKSVPGVVAAWGSLGPHAPDTLHKVVFDDAELGNEMVPGSVLLAGS